MSTALQKAYGNPNMLTAVQRVYGSDFCPFAESLVLKYPTDGAGFTFHQDALRSGPYEVGQQEELGMNCGIYLTPSSKSNGCASKIHKHSMSS
eukprot:SAG31_NODE_3601_length_4085_cov_1.880582_4_plen_93_part_00